MSAHGVHVLSKLSLGEDHTLHQIPAEMTRAVPHPARLKQTLQTNAGDFQKKKKDWLSPHSFQPGFVQGIPAVRLNSSFLAFSTGIHSFGQSQPWQNENVNSLPR